MRHKRVKETIESFQSFYNENLTDIDGAEIQKNVSEFIFLLDRWNERRKNGLN